jgi:CRISPR type III-B/RAMP module RAMP protein Cmr1
MAQGAKRPAAPTAGVTRREVQDTSTLAFDVDVVTYVQGGGVAWDDSDEKRHVKRIDAITPFRPSSVRGHLRFWWRATHGCTSASLEEMRAREGRLWGLASEPSKVTVKVTGQSAHAGGTWQDGASAIVTLARRSDYTQDTKKRQLRRKKNPSVLMHRKGSRGSEPEVRLQSCCKKKKRKLKQDR